MVAIIALALCAVFAQFGSLGRQAPLSLSSQAESAPTIRAATARTDNAPVAHFEPRRVVAAGSPALALGDAPRDRGDDPSTVRPDEQPVKPLRSSCSTQTYKVPSESGGEATIKMVRCNGQ